MPTREQRLGGAEVVVAEALLDEAPRVDREAGAVEEVGDGRRLVGRPGSCASSGLVTSGPVGVVAHSSSSRSDDDLVGAVLDERVGPDAAVDADDEAEVAGLAGGDAAERVLEHHRTRAGSHPELLRRRTRNVSGAGLPARCALGGHAAVDDGREVVDHVRRRAARPGRCASWRRPPS